MIITALMALCCLALFMPHMASACMCSQEHPQTQYCRADFVMKAHVRKSQTVFTKRLVERRGKMITVRYPLYISYQLHVSKVFKDTEAYRNISAKFSERTSFVTTSPDEGMCGVTLKNDTKYLISGFVSGGKAHINMCTMIEKWNDVHVRQRKGIQYQYEKNCQCQIKNCYGSNCPQNLRTFCSLDQSDPGVKCYEHQNLCHHHSDIKACKWGKPATFARCLQTARQEAQSREP